MYQEFFDLQEEPFAITPNPRFLFLSRRHREALAHLLYGVGRGGGFMQLTGEVGTGKTTLCRGLLAQTPTEVDTALILNPRQNATELLASICDELGIGYPAGTDSLKVLVDALNRHLLDAHARGRRTVLIIDEAQSLSIEVLEQIRLLTNLETATEKLLQIILIGQPELQELLSRPELRQLAQRTTAHYHLGPLTAAETMEYIRHRLQVAGCRQTLFSQAQARQVHRLAGGIPRLINAICDRTLLGAYGEQRRNLSPHLVRQAAREVIRSPARSRPQVPVAVAVGLSSLVLAVALTGGWRYLQPPGPSAGPAASVTSPRALAAAPLPTAPVPTNPDPAAARPSLPAASSPSAAAPHVRPTRPPLGQMLGRGTFRTDTTAAFTTLFGYWNLGYRAEDPGPACEQALQAGLSCLHGTSSLEDLQRYNRPAVIELVDPHGQRHLGVVTHLAEAQLTLRFGERRVSTDRDELLPLWDGDFVLLWRPPPGGAHLLKTGISGPDVIWLRRQLARARGTEASGVPLAEQFDADLRAQVLAFQRVEGLTPDGIVGVQTLLRLNAITAAPDVPLIN